MKKPSAYEIATHKGRQADEARSSDYCGSCSIEIHCAQVRDPKSWVHSSIKVWEKLGGWGEEENSEAKDSPKSAYETVASVMAERDALRAQVEAMRALLVDAHWTVHLPTTEHAIIPRCRCRKCVISRIDAALQAKP